MSAPLGRGLDALLGGSQKDNSQKIPIALEAPVSAPTLTNDLKHGLEDGQLLFLPLTQIKLNPLQPRRDFDPEALAQLASSIQQHGLLQPLVVIKDGSSYILLAGERRFRACQMLGLQEVPVLMKEAEPEQRLVLSLVENIQRENLSVMEKAEAYQKLVETLGLSYEEIAHKLGISRSGFNNTLRLLKLPLKAKEALRAGKVSEGQMLTFMSAGDETTMLALLDKFLNQEINFEEVKQAVQTSRLGNSHGLKSRKPLSLQPEDVINVRALEEKFGVKADVKRGRDKSITISFQCHDDIQYRELAEKLKASL